MLPPATRAQVRSLTLSLVRAQFKKNTDLARARQQVINRLQTLQTLPVGVSANPRASAIKTELFRQCGV
jgi:Cu/Ag efflux pump CusA